MFKQLIAITLFFCVGLVTMALARDIQSTEVCLTGQQEALMTFTEAGDIALHTGQYSEAIEAYTCALTIEPGYYPAYYGRGIAYQDTGNHELAIQDFLMTLDYSGHSDNPELYQHLAHNYTAINSTADAAFYYGIFLASQHNLS